MMITVVGGGFVGVATAVVLAEQGHRVVLVEQDARRRDSLAAGHVPFHEAGLNEAWRARLQEDTLQLGAELPAEAPDLVLLCVGTPPAPNGTADLSQVHAASDALRRAAPSWPKAPVIAIKSTVPPGTTQAVRKALLASGHLFPLAMTPEFLREGTALADARAPERVVIGSHDPEAVATLQRLHAHLRCPIRITDPTTAELVKLAANAMLAVRISFANEISRLCESLGVDIDETMTLVGLDSRIGPAFLHAGPGFGGSCFPKDLAALGRVAAELGHPLPIVAATLATNDEQPRHVVDTLARLMDGLDGRRVALLGLSFKHGTSDIRESRSLRVHGLLETRGAHVVGHDPIAAEAYRDAYPGAETVTDVRTALTDADAAVVMTADPVYAALTAEPFLRMRRPLVYDTRRILDQPRLRSAGVETHALGRGPLAGPRLEETVV